MTVNEVKKAINKIIRSKGRFPTVQEISNLLNCTEKQTRKYMEVLLKKGEVVKHGDWYIYPDETDTESQEINSEPEEEEVEEKSKVMYPMGYINNNDMEEEFNDKENKIIPVFMENEEKESGEAKEISGGAEGVQSSIRPEEIDMGSQDGTLIEKELEIKEVHPVNYKPLEFTEEKAKKSFKDFAKSDKIKKIINNLNNKSNNYSENNINTKQISIIKTAMGIIGIGAAIISIYYVTWWMLEYLPAILAFLTSIIMVSFSVFAFETVILFFTEERMTKKQWTRLALSIVLIILWMIVSVFNASSIVAGRYLQNIENNKIASVQNNNTDNISWNLLQENKADIKSRINLYKDQIKSINDLTDIEPNIKQWRARKVTDNIDKLSLELDKIRKKELTILNESKKDGTNLQIKEGNIAKENKDFYAWLAGIFGIAEDKIQFVISLIYGVFCDFISPIAIALALFLNKRA